MARTIAVIQQQIIDTLVSNMAIIGVTIDPTGWSTTDVNRLWTYVVAVCIWTLETLFDLHVQEVKDIITNTKPHRAQWYTDIAKKFQLGYNLVPDQDYYDNTGLTDAQIATAQVVKYAAVQEINRGIRIKVATITGSDLAPLSTLQLNAFQEYMARVKDAGVRLYFVNSPADSLQLSLKIYFDALVMDGTGARLDGTATTPVPDAITAFLQNQPFNGLFVLARLVDALQAVDGVIIPDVVFAQAKYGTLPYASIDVEYRPDAGYLRIITPLTDLIIQYIAHEPV